MGQNQENKYSRMTYNAIERLCGVVAEVRDVLKEIAHNQHETVATPVISLSNNKASITCATSGATIHYTTDGTTPTAASPVYSDALTISTSGTVVKAIAVKLDCHDSAVASKQFDIVAKPDISFTTTNGKVTMTCETADAEIHYTNDGSTPTAASTKYTGEFNQPVSETTYKAIAVKSGMIDSAVESETFTPAN